MITTDRKPKKVTSAFRYRIDDTPLTTSQDIQKARRFRKWAYYPIASCLAPCQLIIAPILRRTMGGIFANGTSVDLSKYETDTEGVIADEKRRNLATPLRLTNGRLVRNRLVKAGITDGLCDFHGNPTDNHLKLYERIGQGGWGMIISPSTSVDRGAVDPSAGNSHVLDEESNLASYSKLARAMKMDHSTGILQLAHPGPLVAYNQRAVAPGPFISKSGRNVVDRSCDILTNGEIETIIDQFATSCRLAEKAGFDGIEVLAANGYLGSVFMSKNINRRTDKWAGDAFVLELMQRLLGNRRNESFSIGIKLNSSDLQKGGLTQEEALETMESLSAMNIDFIEIGGGTYQNMDTRYAVKEIEGASSQNRESFFIDFAERVTASEKINVPILTVGGWEDVSAMSEAVEQNPQMMIGFGRATCVDPELAKRLINTSVSKIPNWFHIHTPKWIIEKQKSDKRDERAIAFAVEMLWYSQSVCSLANGEQTPRTGKLFHNPIEALAFKVHLFIKGFLPRSWLIGFFKDHPLRKPLKEKEE